VSVVFDCAGYIKSMKGDAPFQTALHLVKDRVARIVMFGAFEGRFELDLMPIIDKQPTIMGSQGYAAEDLVLALRWMAEGVVDRKKLITATFPLQDAAKAFEVQGQSSEQIKVLITL
jgi:threonine dehydrogenase-like Zn-dependent dehydrogenase